jgi:hypothetical protein
LVFGYYWPAIDVLLAINVAIVGFIDIVYYSAAIDDSYDILAIDIIGCCYLAAVDGSCYCDY